MSENSYCPCCGRHCSLSEPQCDRGREYLKTGVIPERRHAHHKAHEGRGHSHYRETDPDQKLIIVLRNLGHIIHCLYEGKGSQKHILIVLLESGPITQRELTERLGIQPGSASEVIGKLENGGLIERTPSEEDRRTSDIRLTESGQIRAQEVTQQRIARHQEMFSCLSEEEKAELFALLERLNHDWDDRYADARKKCRQ